LCAEHWERGRLARLSAFWREKRGRTKSSWKHAGEFVSRLKAFGAGETPALPAKSLLMNFKIEDLAFDEYGLIPAIVQDANTREVLTLAYMNAESLQRTIATQETWFWSRSRSALWHKGETSGNTQRVIDIHLDCDQDALVVLVEPAGPACHTGERSCFHNQIVGIQESELRSQESGVRRLGPGLGDALDQLHELIQSRYGERPSGSYTTYLFDKGLDKILKKVGEESAETIIAAKGDDRQALIAETADLLYHLLVLLVDRGVGLEEIKNELAQRGQNRLR
jgi:phosphoribosyl-AMP cyclohydrolase / phosphoribosyl-ATP pyrophosphohydrolase